MMSLVWVVIDCSFGCVFLNPCARTLPQILARFGAKVSNDISLGEHAFSFHHTIQSCASLLFGAAGIIVHYIIKAIGGSHGITLQSLGAHLVKIFCLSARKSHANFERAVVPKQP